MKKVCLIVFNPFVNDSRVLKEAISLSRVYDVDVVAHLDNNLKQHEIFKGINIFRFGFLDRKVTTSKLKKIFVYIQFLKRTIFHVRNYDIIHCNDLITLPIGYLIKKIYNKNVKIVYDAHEYETETNGLSGAEKKIMKLMEGFLIRQVDSVITVSNAIAREYVKQYKIPKVSLVLNTPFYKKVEKKNIFRNHFGIQKTSKIFLYQGGLSLGRGIHRILEAFKTAESDCVIVFMGYGVLKDEIEECASKFDNIYFYNAVDYDRLLNYTSSADYGISIIEDTCLSYRYSLPNKLFEYIMADLPVIVSNLPEMKSLVMENDIGVVAEDDSVLSLKNAIDKIVKMEYNNFKSGLHASKLKYNWENQEKKLLNLYGELCYE